MVTKLARHSITETPEIAAAIDAGADLLPGASRAEVTRFLILRGAEAARRDSAGRLAALDRWAGCLSGGYPPNAAETLKDEWPD